MQLEFIGFNRIRAERGAKPAKFILTDEEGNTGVFWMDRDDIVHNIRQRVLPDNRELVKALTYFGKVKL